MTTTELCESAGLSRSNVQQWLECGLLEAENVGIPGGGVRRIFAPGQLERARLVKALLRKGVSLARLAAADLSFEASQAYVVYDGRELRACRNAAAAIAAVVQARRWCSAVDLSAVRAGIVE
jgi:DNA-binding transcriptional MerR regulator